METRTDKAIVKKHIGQQIREARISLRMTQRELAEATGMSLGHLVTIERNEDSANSASRRVLRNIVKVLDVELVRVEIFSPEDSVA